jgi:hypothetical protein
MDEVYFGYVPDIVCIKKYPQNVAHFWLISNLPSAGRMEPE